MSSEDALQVVISMHRLLRGLRRASDADAVPPTQLIVLALLNQHGALRIGALATRIPCSQPTATTVVASMQSDGLVRREPDPTDGRATHVVPTEEGLRTLQSIARGQAEVLVELLADMPPDEVALLLAAAPVLQRLADLRTAPVVTTQPTGLFQH
ncbi:MAG TPA: MarR family transcriptional regulator [Pseudonocardia sp.]